MADDAGPASRVSSPPPVAPLLPPSESSESAALAALAKKKSFFGRFRSHRSKTKPPRASVSSETLEGPPADAASIDISFPEPGTASDALHSSSEPAVSTAGRRGRDVYEWVTLYENQRGWTLLSTPYYSSATLLPFDPAAFTVSLPSGQLTVQDKEQFQLPDPTWKWVSKWWMIDMRSDGAVQWDGFEYNWLFKQKRWRPRVGPLSAGGYVRRRRWVRLMVRPATDEELAEDQDGGPGSVHSSPMGSERDGGGEDEVWRGDEDDWTRCAAVMKRLERDGRKLEVWRSWLGVVVSHDRRRQWTEDNEALDESPFMVLAQDSNPPVREEWLLAVLRVHAREVLHQFFIFPDSRAQFLELLLRAGLGDRLADTGIFDDGAGDFYSRSPSLATIEPSKPSVPHSLSAIKDEGEDEQTDADSRSRQPSVAQAQDEKEQAADALDKVQVGADS
ncbi:hypothetical protein EXIGLDRAFT_734622 [Exidia glandulosa HHB12029]|uniref:TECPR1-like DysF domain-containing protein n=1 Tax=Exidia glandulosa HHB12029 TaxID=1314781 RepID=A0A165PQ76_EXIGL|nr:hypothetical protein EXIGLDRAFT_734622 [Exidia glandulosa HHB12029]